MHGALDEPQGQPADDLSSPLSSSPGMAGGWVQRALARHTSANPCAPPTASFTMERGRPDSHSARGKPALPITHTGTAPVDLIPGGGPDLRAFADQLVAMAEQLRAGHYTAAGSRPPDFMTSPHAIDPTGEALAVPVAEAARKAREELTPEHRSRFVEMARATYTKRRKRADIFGDPDLFGEPGWDILLDLYIAEADGKPVSVSSACIGSAAPPTTGLRWLGVLAEQGLVDRQHDPQDQRRVLVHLTDKAMAAMDEYFALSLALDQAHHGMHV